MTTALQLVSNDPLFRAPKISHKKFKNKDWVDLFKRLELAMVKYPRKFILPFVISLNIKSSTLRNRYKGWITQGRPEADQYISDGRKTGSRKTFTPAEEALLLEKTEKMLDKNIVFSNEMLKASAIALHKRLYPKAVKAFTASNGWMRRFKRLYRLVSISITTKRGPSKKKKLLKKEDKICEEFRSLMKDVLRGVGVSRVVNADETPYGSVHKNHIKTNIPKGDERRVLLEQGNLWLSCTVISCIFADGRSLKTDVLLPGTTELCTRNLPTSSRISVSPNGSNYVTTEAMFRLFDRIRAAQDAERHLKGKLTVVLLDACTVHWVDEVVDYALSKNLMLIQIPEGYTRYLQPLDVGYFGGLKSSARAAFFREYLPALEKKESWMTVKNLLKIRLRALDYALSHVSIHTIITSFDKAFAFT